MAISKLETDRLILRKFEDSDIGALYRLLKDKEVNTFLSWFSVKNMEETKAFYNKRLAGQKYCFAICLKEDNFPIGYIHVSTDESHDLGYALDKKFWHKGIVTEAARALIGQLKQDGVPLITATHDKSNLRSGVIYIIGRHVKYCYSDQGR